jgi:peptidoglycan DL-endopeptidase CwlO
MARRLCFGLVLLLVAAAAGSDALGSTPLSTLQSRIADARAREHALTSEITAVTGQIRRLEAREGDVSRRLSVLDRDLRLHRERLAKLAELYRLQTDRLHFLRSQYRLSIDRFSLRLIDLYEGGEVTNLDVALSSGSFRDLIDELFYMKAIAHEDAAISQEVKRARVELRVARARTKTARVGVSAETRVIAVRTYQVRIVHDRLLAADHRLSKSRSTKRSSLVAVQESEREFLNEANGMLAASAEVTARIRDASASAPIDRTISSHGLVWPVSGPVTSPFGMRWGRMHEGIDIGVGYGTPIHAAGSGTVIYARWESGYGNFTIIDHGGGIATAYGHQSAIAVHVGEQVSQGELIGYVGCTGHCFGPHLHFEVRINGTAVDPLGYL